jgi:hypothetical protein
MGTCVRMALCALATCAMLNAGSTARAGLVISSSVGGAPAGVSYANFDNLALGSGGGSSNVNGLPGTLNIAFTPDAGVVNGAASGVYAPPFLSGGNGANFGPGGTNQADLTDLTNYITTGADDVSHPGANATITFGGAKELYFGLLWGSVDSFNTLTFLNGTTVVGTVTGSEVLAFPIGDQGQNGTTYVNINSDLQFDTVVATSSTHAFEFDNVSFNVTAVPIGTPEPSTILSASIAVLVGLGYSYNQRRRRAKVVA